VTEKPRGSRQSKSEPDTGSEPPIPMTNSPGSVGPVVDLDAMTEEEIEYHQRRKFTWQEGDVQVLYDPYAEERESEGSSPEGE
jgi:hypothetical protein